MVSLIILFLRLVSVARSIICKSREEGERIAKIFVGGLLYFEWGGHDGTACPTDDWLLSMAQHDFPKRTGTFINVGFNKGFNYALWLNMFLPWSGVTNSVLFQGIQSKSTNTSLVEPACGACMDCMVNIPWCHRCCSGQQRPKRRPLPSLGWI